MLSASVHFIICIYHNNNQIDARVLIFIQLYDKLRGYVAMYDTTLYIAYVRY